MSQPIQLVAVIASSVLLVLVLDLIRRRRLKEELWAVWLLLSFGVLACSLWLGLWSGLAHALGIRYEPALLMILGIFLALGLILHLTVVLSGLMRQNQILAQEVAQLTWRLEQSERPGTRA